MKKNLKETKTVLVVEDDQPLLAVIKMKLEKEGMHVITSRSVDRVFSIEIEKNAANKITMSSVELSLKHLNDLDRIDAVWLDHNLLGSENGLDFVIKFKDNGGHWEKIPIFVVSNTADPELVQKYAAAQVPNYYVKAEHTLESIVNDIKNVLLGEKK
ncbi:MAG: response regulator [Patescibacteria group bacterium]